MLFTYLIMKLTFQSILNECNRLAAERQSKEQITWLKARLLRLRLEYEKGKIDDESYNRMQEEILRDIREST